MPRKDLTTPDYTRALVRAGFQSAIGPAVPLAAAHVLDNSETPGRRFVRQEGCPLRAALAHLLRDLAAAKRAARKGRH